MNNANINKYAMLKYSYTYILVSQIRFDQHCCKYFFEISNYENYDNRPCTTNDSNRILLGR